MPYGHGVAPSDVSPNSRRSAKSQRPYSADVNQLFALNEDTRSSSGGSFKKGIQTFKLTHKMVDSLPFILELMVLDQSSQITI